MTTYCLIASVYFFIGGIIAHWLHEKEDNLFGHFQCFTCGVVWPLTIIVALITLLIKPDTDDRPNC